MNGAELPCGSIIQVEPATRNYGNDPKQQASNVSGTKSIHSDPVDNVESSATEVTTSAPLPASDENDATQPTTDNADDLDEFFDSL
jgi:hypothetical protein